MTRSPDDHYAIAERETDQAHKVRDVIDQHTDNDFTRAQFERHVRLAELHRKMAETGLAFEKPAPVKFARVEADAYEGTDGEGRRV